jgi:hypothetical protein
VEGGRIDDEHLRAGIGELEQLVLKRSQRMQPGQRQPRQLRSDARAPAVGGEKSRAGARRQAERDEDVLHPPDQIDRALIGERAARPGKGCARRIARQRPQGLARKPSEMY